MAKRDFYDVLGVSKDANPDQLKSAYRKLAVNIILIKILAINRLKKNLKKLAKLMEFSQIKRKNKIMITLVMPHLKMVVEDKVVVLEDLVVLISQIFLRIFSGILAEVEGQEVVEIQITEVLI